MVSAISCAPDVLAVHGGDIEHLRLLRGMGMIGSLVDAQISELAASERTAGQHALDRLLDDPLGKFALEQEFRRALLDAADVPGVMMIDFAIDLAAGQDHLFGID